MLARMKAKMVVMVMLVIIRIICQIIKFHGDGVFHVKQYSKRSVIFMGEIFSEISNLKPILAETILYLNSK